MKAKKLIGAAVVAVALSATVVAPAYATTVVTGGDVEMVLFGSGYHVTTARIHAIEEPQGPANYEFVYSATTSPTKTYTFICGGDSTGGSCHHDFTINATYAHGASIKSCGEIHRTDNGQSLGTACKKW